MQSSPGATLALSRRSALLLVLKPFGGGDYTVAGLWTSTGYASDCARAVLVPDTKGEAIKIPHFSPRLIVSASELVESNGNPTPAIVQTY